MLKWRLYQLKEFFKSCLKFYPTTIEPVELNNEYINGLWDALTGLEEVARFGILSSLIINYKSSPKILEIGSGEGTLGKNLNMSKISSFVGLDISEEAIRRANEQKHLKEIYLEIDALNYDTQEKFDIIIFNECLEYFNNHDFLLKKYNKFLENDGIVIVSMFRESWSFRSEWMWSFIHKIYSPIDKIEVKNNKGIKWDIEVLKPKIIGPNK